MKIILALLCFVFMSIQEMQAQWSTTGNTGATPPTNYLGTNDGNPLMFKVTGTQAGLLENASTFNNSIGYNSFVNNTTGYRTSVFGSFAMYNNTTGYDNNAFGVYSLAGNISGYGNSAMGNYSLTNNYSGLYNAAFGNQSMFTNAYGSNNVAVGYSSLYNNYSGSRNVALGMEALYSSGGDDNVAAGYGALHDSYGSENTALGSYSLYANRYGSRNTGNGFKSLYINYTGNDNSATGYQALYNNSAGSRNSAVGTYALYSSTGDDNVATGYFALYSNNASGNTATGSYCLYANTTGYANSGNGFRSLYSNSTGIANTASGYEALFTNSSGVQNSSFGYHTLYNSSTGSYNTAIGMEALVSNTTGYMNIANGYQANYSNTYGQYNVVVGADAMFASTGASQNIALGNQALYNAEGSNCIAAGYQSLYYNTTGSKNVGIGSFALTSNTTGNNNTAIGYYAGSGSTTLTNATSLGYYATATASNSVMIGNSSVSWIGGYSTWTSLSDGRAKKNIKSNVPGLSFINKISPVTYTVDLEAVDRIHNFKPILDSTGIVQSEEIIAARKKKEAIVYSGFVAQDVEQVAKSLNYNFSGVAVPENDNETYGLRYSEFVVPLVKAVQELSKINDSLGVIVDGLKKENVQIQSNFNNLLLQVAEIKAIQSNCCPVVVPNNINNQTTSIQKTSITSETGMEKTVISSPSLQQNKPNPFSNSTLIKFFLPSSIKNAKINVSDNTGRILKSYNISSDQTQITVKGSEFLSGTYFYSLVINGSLFDTKKMILLK